MQVTEQDLIEKFDKGDDFKLDDVDARLSLDDSMDTQQTESWDDSFDSHCQDESFGNGVEGDPEMGGVAGDHNGEDDLRLRKEGENLRLKVCN